MCEKSGLKFVHRLVFSLNGQRAREMTLDRVAFDVAPASPALAELQPLASDVASGGVPYQWVSRRVPMGGYAEAQSTSKMHFEEIAPGLELVAGRSHNALVVVQAKSLLVVDASLDEAYTGWVIAACKARFPDKSITTLVLTHHHNDHTVRLYRIENTHAQGMLFVYLPAQHLGFVADLWSQARDNFGSALTFDRHRELVTALTGLKLEPERIAGGHGEVGSYAELQAENYARIPGE